MKLRIDRLALEGPSRTPLYLSPGLNVIVGPVSTGKTSLMRLLRIALGGEVEGIYPEVKATVSGLAFQLVVGETEYSVRRRLVTTPTAAVEIASYDEALSLPAMHVAPSEPLAYGDWLLTKLELPRLEVPTAPTRPAESATTRVSINDYLRYCRLTQEEIDVDVLGSSVWFKDNKRRIAFRILYGSYDAEVALLQQQLREVQAELRVLEAGEGAFTRFLSGTPFANRAQLEAQLKDAESQAAVVHHERIDLAQLARQVPRAQQLQEEVAALDSRAADLATDIERERKAAQDLLRLRNQLQSQSARLTRSIVAGEVLFDFDFKICPRCGNPVDDGRTEPGTCYLCLQEEPPAPSRDDLVREQARVNSQLAETEDLVAAREAVAEQLVERLAETQTRRTASGFELDEVLVAFVSDRAEEVAGQASRASALAGETRRLRDYLAVFDKYASEQARAAELAARSDAIQLQLDRADQVDAEAEARIRVLEDRFHFFVDRIDIPSFAGFPRAGIDRANYEPIVNGRHLDGLSAGVRVLVNVAHLLAHHIAAIDLGLPLPGVLLIDGLTKNIGTAEYDAQRIENVWRTLLDLHETRAEELQIVVAVNDVPDFVPESHIALRLSEEDRLIPAVDLAAIGWGSSDADADESDG